VELRSHRLVLRPLRVHDFEQWSEVRVRCADWLSQWEPFRDPGSPDPTRDRYAFAARCNARYRERQLGTGYANGLFHDGHFVGEINVSNAQRGPFQSAQIGYWVDERWAGHGFVPEGLTSVFADGFDRVGLHRFEIAIIPRNTSSLRVVEKLGVRFEGVAERYLEINGTWEDHARFAITAEEWEERRTELLAFSAGRRSLDATG
jgi:ribosomal-protein-alanine N-acetyltransferase